MKRNAFDMAIYGREMVNLYRMIVQAIPVDSGAVRNGRVIEVVAARPKEGVSTVVRMLAEVAGGIGGARVLICDATAMRVATSSAFKSSLRDIIGVTDLSSVYQWVPSADAAGRRLLSDRSGAARSNIAKLGMESEVALRIDKLDEVFTGLRGEFDLILIDAGSTSQGTLGLALAKKADRVVLVVEADRTRVQAAAAARHAIELNGGQVLGVVLNKRRLRIPRIFSHWIGDA